MDLPHLVGLTILSIVLFGLPEATSQRWNEDRSEGYDLQKGPVFYEAYYPDERGQPARGKQPIPMNAQVEKRFENAGNTLEKTYQSLQDPSHDIPYRRYPRELQNQQEFDSPLLQNTVKIQARKIVEELKRLVEGLEEDVNFQHSPERRSYRGNLENSNIDADKRFDDSINIILSAVKNSQLRISEEDLASLRQNEEQKKSQDNFFRLSNPLVKSFEAKFNSGNQPVISYTSGFPGRRNGDWSVSSNRDDELDRFSGNDYEDVRGPISGMAYRRMENIFQPRPQVINYVFSPTREPTISSDHLVSEIKKESKNLNGMKPGIASIEVSEVTHHKIRHHHGEKPRRNRRHRQTESGNQS